MNPSVLRSIARVVGDALPGFEIRHAAEDIGDFARPCAAVVTASPTSSSLAGGGARYAELRGSYQVTAYPVAGHTPDESRTEAERVQHELWKTLAAGIDSGRARAMRIPVWDYADTALSEPGPEQPVGYLRVIETPTFEAITVGDGWVVIASLRCSWTEGISRPPGPPVQYVGSRFGG